MWDIYRAIGLNLFVLAESSGKEITVVDSTPRMECSIRKERDGICLYNGENRFMLEPEARLAGKRGAVDNAMLFQDLKIVNENRIQRIVFGCYRLFEYDKQDPLILEDGFSSWFLDSNLYLSLAGNRIYIGGSAEEISLERAVEDVMKALQCKEDFEMSRPLTDGMDLREAYLGIRRLDNNIYLEGLSADRKKIYMGQRLNRSDYISIKHDSQRYALFLESMCYSQER